MKGITRKQSLEIEFYSLLANDKYTVSETIDFVNYVVRGLGNPNKIVHHKRLFEITYKMWKRDLNKYLFIWELDSDLSTSEYYLKNIRPKLLKHILERNITEGVRR